MDERIMKNLILGLGLFVSTTTIAFAGSAVNLVSETGDWVGMGQAYDYSDTNSIIKISTDTVDVDGEDYNSITVIVKTPDADGIYSVISWTMRFAAPINDQIQPGLYSDIERYNSFSRDNPRMSIEAYSHGCFGVVGSFEVSDVSYDADGNADSLVLNFVQRCDNATSPALTGDIAISLAAVGVPPTTGSDEADADDDDGQECKKDNKDKKEKKFKEEKKPKKDKKPKKEKKPKKDKKRDC